MFLHDYLNQCKEKLNFHIVYKWMVAQLILDVLKVITDSNHLFILMNIIHVKND